MLIFPKSVKVRRIFAHTALLAALCFAWSALPSNAAETKPSYEKARWDPIHFKPAIDKATNEQCLACHKEILDRKVSVKSPAGIKAKKSLAWYQTLDTYMGEQETFHARHLTTSYAKAVMDLKCNFCHQGNDPREEAPSSHAGNQGDKAHTLRKMVNPMESCLMCHGTFPYKFMEGIEEDWHKIRVDLEDEDNPNGCLSCHAESFRTVRHQVNYLNDKAIEELAKESSDVCYGCHGGRKWFRISYPYPRHTWPGMEDFVEETPEWAKSRPTESAKRHRRNK